MMIAVVTVIVIISSIMTKRQEVERERAERMAATTP